VASWPILVAIGCFGSALIAPPIPIWFAGGIMVASLLRIRPMLLAVGLIVLSGALAGQAQVGNRQLAPGQFEGIVQLTTDPTSTVSSTSATVRTHHGRLRMVAYGAAAGRVRPLSAGDRARVVGKIESGRILDPSRHLRGDLIIASSSGRLGRTPFIRAIEALRATIVDGAAVLPDSLRPLYLGFVIGDDRGSSPLLRADMQASGLGHLTVVSGQNLAFVLLVLSPLLTRVGVRQRFLIIVVVLLIFAAVTRFEPSILRATMMACVVAVTFRIGRPASALRIVSLAVIAIILVDPLIVWSLGFRLSLAATVGIVVLAPPISRQIPGPRRLAQVIAVPIAAQIGVAPVAIPVFGPQPLLSVLANVLAAPAAAVVMMWGCTAGVLAGLVGDGPAVILHQPTVLGLQWVVMVARVISSLPPVGIGLLAVAMAAVAGVLLGLLRGRGRVAVMMVCVMSLLLPAVAGRQAPKALVDARIGGARVWVSGGSERSVVVVIGGDVDVADLLAGLRKRGVRRIDLLVRSSGVPNATEAERQILERVTVGRKASVDGPEPPDAGSVERIDLGDLVVTLDRSDPRLEVDVGPGSEPDPVTGRG
jgi:competence protein ComEC